MSFHSLKVSTLAAALAAGLALPAFAESGNTESVNPSERLPDASINEQTGMTENDDDSSIIRWMTGEGETGAVQAPQNTNPTEDDPTATATENVR